MKNLIEFKPTKKSDLTPDIGFPEDLYTSENYLHPEIPWLTESPQNNEKSNNKNLGYYQDILRNKFKTPKPTKINTPYSNDNNPIIQSILNTDYSNEDKNYLLVLAKRESSYNPKAVSGSYKGLYQFGKAALDTVGYTLDEYLGDINVQHDSALKLASFNERILQDELKHIGKNIKGINITRNGIRAAAHLLGPKAVKKFFAPKSIQNTVYKNVRDKDGNGTTVADYLKLFE